MGIHTDRTDIAATVYMFRHRDPKHAELVAHFVYSDLADETARALCERYHYAVEVHYTDETFKPTRYEWRDTTIKAVTEVNA